MAPPIRTWLRAALVWLLLLLLAVLNGGLRDTALTPRLGEPTAHVISTLTLSILISCVAWWTIPWTRLESARHAWFVGSLWLSLTLAFEFLAGHFLFRNSWAKLLADYNVAQGRIWILVLFVTLLAPVWCSRVKALKG